MDMLGPDPQKKVEHVLATALHRTQPSCMPGQFQTGILPGYQAGLDGNSLLLPDKVYIHLCILDTMTTGVMYIS